MWSVGNGNPLMCALNIQSVKPNTVELIHELQLFRYDIAVLCETWLKPHVPNHLLAFPGYTLHRSDRKFAPKGYGGVVVLFRDGIEVRRIGVPASASGLSRLGSLWGLFRWNRSKVVIGAVHRQSRSTGSALEADFEDLERQYQHVLLNYPDCVVVITGDLTCNMLGDVDAAAHVACRPPFYHHTRLLQLSLNLPTSLVRF